jgi:protein-tyrosine phosphatase
LIKVLFVCLGNICRSPTGEGVFRALVEREGLGDQISVDSAGTAGYHVGNSPDPRSQAAAKQRGIDMSRQRARQVRADDFEKFDYLMAMDGENYSDLMRICPSGLESRIYLMLDFGEGHDRRDVPDPYYTGGNGFEVVLDLIENASQGLLEDIRNKHL